jgi:hypothetical protein
MDCSTGAERKKEHEDVGFVLGRSETQLSPRTSCASGPVLLRLVEAHRVAVGRVLAVGGHAQLAEHVDDPHEGTAEEAEDGHVPTVSEPVRAPEGRTRDGGAGRTGPGATRPRPSRGGPGPRVVRACA